MGHCATSEAPRVLSWPFSLFVPPVVHLPDSHKKYSKAKLFNLSGEQDKSTALAFSTSSVASMQ